MRCPSRPDRRRRARPAPRARLGAARRLALGAGALVLAACGRVGGAPVRVTVPAGASFRTATDSLARHGVVRFPRLFRLYAKLQGEDRSVKPGTYALRRDEPWGTVLEALVEGKGLVHVLVVPEGRSLATIVPQLARTLEVPEDSVEAAVRDSALRAELDVPTPTLEGYLFPATYTFRHGTTARQAVTAMVQRFEQAWKPAWNDQLQALALDRHQVVTLASIVELEARYPEERPVIAAVYLNRLRIGMPLQADPTVQYARGAHTARVLYKDLAIASPYNTYLHRGLPPGPIASPGEASLEAVLMPAKVPYLYFVALPDGHHEFHTDFRSHTQAVREIRRLQAPARGARPGR